MSKPIKIKDAGMIGRIMEIVDEITKLSPDYFNGIKLQGLINNTWSFISPYYPGIGKKLESLRNKLEFGPHDLFNEEIFNAVKEETIALLLSLL